MAVADAHDRPEGEGECTVAELKIRKVLFLPIQFWHLQIGYSNHN